MSTINANLNRVFALELARVTERAAVAAARCRGLGDEVAADKAAVDAMRAELNVLPIAGTVVIGEGERDEAPMLFIGEEVGLGSGPKVDIALDPLEGTTLCAKSMPNSLAVLAMSEEGGMLNAPDTYMEKIAIGGGYPAGVIDIDASTQDNIRALAKAKGVGTSQITACILDRPRHAKYIEGVRAAGGRVHLITDGDVAGVIATSDPVETGIDIYIGIGGAPEGVLAAAALRCVGGQMQGRIVIRNADEEERAKRIGIEDLTKIYALEELASGDVLFAATGVTDGSMLKGVRFLAEKITTETVIMRSSSGTVRWIRSEHARFDKFE
ncbi:MAG: class II fructose-bisphosphatase [Alphaproteobacteria bacterium]